MHNFQSVKLQNGGVSVTIWVYAQVKVKPCKRITAVRSAHMYHWPGLSQSHFVQEFLRINSCAVHKSKPVSRVRPDDSCQGKAVLHRMEWDTEYDKSE